MICPFCSSANPENSQHCANCGRPLPPSDQQPNYNYSQPQGPVSNSPRFVDPSETAIASLNNGALMNVISGEGIKKEAACVTNKRLYYVHRKGILNRRSEEEIIDVKDITGTKIIDHNPIWLIILCILCILNFVVMFCAFVSSIEYMDEFTVAPAILAFIVFPGILLFLYFIRRKKYLIIEYAGGLIRFSLIGYKMEDIRSFQHKIYEVKDKQ